MIIDHDRVLAVHYIARTFLNVWQRWEADSSKPYGWYDVQRRNAFILERALWEMLARESSRFSCYPANFMRIRACGGRLEIGDYAYSKEGLLSLTVWAEQEYWANTLVEYWASVKLRHNQCQNRSNNAGDRRAVRKVLLQCKASLCLSSWTAPLKIFDTGEDELEECWAQIETLTHLTQQTLGVEAKLLHLEGLLDGADYECSWAGSGR